MMCPSCQGRKSKRFCPALGAKICPVCCGTKRVVEIACPSDCGYLAASRTHPPAQVQRRRDRDLRFVAGLIRGLPERAFHLMLVLQDGIVRYREAAIPPLSDADVAEAAGTLAATLETAGKGIIYEHQAGSIPAQRLVRSLQELLEALKKRPSTRSAVELDAGQALRRIEQAARGAREAFGEGDTSYLELLGRLPRELGTEGGPHPPEAAPAARSAGEDEPPEPDTPRIVLA
jgi:hypothetical protein